MVITTVRRLLSLRSFRCCVPHGTVDKPGKLVRLCFIFPFLAAQLIPAQISLSLVEPLVAHTPSGLVCVCIMGHVLLTRESAEAATKPTHAATPRVEREQQLIDSVCCFLPNVAKEENNNNKLAPTLAAAHIKLGFGAVALGYPSPPWLTGEARSTWVMGRRAGGTEGVVRPWRDMWRRALRVSH
jgi:hypothetical protein